MLVDDRARKRVVCVLLAPWIFAALFAALGVLTALLIRPVAILWVLAAAAVVIGALSIRTIARVGSEVVVRTPWRARRFDSGVLSLTNPRGKSTGPRIVLASANARVEVYGTVTIGRAIAACERIARTIELTAEIDPAFAEAAALERRSFRLGALIAAILLLAIGTAVVIGMRMR